MLLSVGEACITQTARASVQAASQPAAVEQTAWPPSELLSEASRQLNGLLHTVDQDDPDGSAHPIGTGSAPVAPLQLLTACAVMVACAAAVHAGAQQAGSVVPEQWSADALVDGASGGVTYYVGECQTLGCDAVSYAVQAVWVLLCSVWGLASHR